MRYRHPVIAWCACATATVVTAGCARSAQQSADSAASTTASKEAERKTADQYRKDIFAAAHRALVSFDFRTQKSLDVLNTELKLLEPAVRTEAERNTLKAIGIARDNQENIVMLEAFKTVSVKASETYDGLVSNGERMIDNARKKEDDERMDAIINDRKTIVTPGAQIAEQVAAQVLEAFEWQREIRDQLQAGNVCFYSPQAPNGLYDFREKVQRARMPYVTGQYGLYVHYDGCMRALRGFNEVLVRTAGEMINNNGLAPPR